MLIKYLFQEIEQWEQVLLALLGSLRGLFLGARACEDAIEAIVILMARVLVERVGLIPCNGARPGSGPCRWIIHGEPVIDPVFAAAHWSRGAGARLKG